MLIFVGLLSCLGLCCHEEKTFQTRTPVPRISKHGNREKSPSRSRPKVHENVRSLRETLAPPMPHDIEELSPILPPREDSSNSPLGGQPLFASPFRLATQFVSPNFDNSISRAVQSLVEESSLNEFEIALLRKAQEVFGNKRGYHIEKEEGRPMSGNFYTVRASHRILDLWSQPDILFNFRPTNLEVGTLNYRMHTHAGRFPFEKEYTPGLGAVREYASYRLHALMAARGCNFLFSIPPTIPVWIEGFGTGILQQEVQKPSLGCSTPDHPPNLTAEYQLRVLFQILTLNPEEDLGCIGKLSSKTRREEVQRNKRNALFFSKHILSFPDSKHIMNVTTMGFRALRVPYMKETFDPKVRAIVLGLKAEEYVPMLRVFGFSTAVCINFEIALEAIQFCVRKKKFTPLQTIRFALTEEPIAFLPFIFSQLEGSEEADTRTFVREMLTLFSQRVKPSNKYKYEYDGVSEHDYRGVLTGC